MEDQVFAKSRLEDEIDHPTGSRWKRMFPCIMFIAYAITGGKFGVDRIWENSLCLPLYKCSNSFFMFIYFILKLFLPTIVQMNMHNLVWM